MCASSDLGQLTCCWIIYGFLIQNREEGSAVIKSDHDDSMPNGSMSLSIYL